MIDLSPRLRQALEGGGRGMRVLILRLGAMGDILRTIPCVRLLRRHLPEAKLGWVLDAGWEILLRDHPDIDVTFALPRREWDAALASPLGWPRLLGDVLGFRKQVAAFETDLALDFHANMRSGWIGRWSGAEVRLGYSGHQQKEGNQWFTTHRVPPGERRTPRVERNLDLVSALGFERGPLPNGGLALALSGREEAAAIVRRLPRRFALLSPSVSAKQEAKKPPTQLLAAAVDRLAERGLPTLVVWGPGEEEDAQRAAAAATSAPLLAPSTSLPVLAALIERAAVFLSGDTGPMHLACALNCPVLAFYGPTDPVVNRPWNVPFRAVYPPERLYTGIKKLDRQGGFDGLSADRVRHAVDELLDECQDR
jgi:ADP-heptose:LPS heptosyltransferase